MTDAKIYVTKLAAAQRQLDAAIRMYFINEEKLAIHTIAAASYRILTDLYRKRHGSFIDAVVHYSIFAMIRDVWSGKMSLNNLPVPEVREFVESVVKDLGAEEPTVDQFAVRLGKRAEIESLRKYSEATNFLKHADRDPSQFIDEESVCIEELLHEAVGVYNFLGAFPTFEMTVLLAYLNKIPKYKTVKPDNEKSILGIAASRLDELSEDKQKEGAAAMLKLNDRYFPRGLTLE